ncbi:peptidylprolyl isomerase [Nocardia sp. NPDC057030]|uniref:peptidylprolyl isomerase n=1 Tax=unclassified Nocardia TaxID=2637762 RepID=UPI0036265A00
MVGENGNKLFHRQRFEHQHVRLSAKAPWVRWLELIGSLGAAVAVTGAGVAVIDMPSAAAAPGQCRYTATTTEQGAKDVGNPPARPADIGTVKATLKIGVGNRDRDDISLDLDGNSAPCTVNSFTYLAGKDFYDNTQCHRLTTGALKVLQCGDPTGTGTGGPSYTFGEENLPKADPGKETATYPKGTVAMANAGAGTNGSQFFLVYGDSELPPAYTVFGKITSGMDLLEQIARAGTDQANGEGDGAPTTAVTIQDVTIARK